jgi:antitoxin MazE
MGVLMAKSTTSKIQRWRNTLAARIPSAIAREAKLAAGQPVEVRVRSVGVAIIPIGQRPMSLAERLRAFDPSRHGGEAMATRPTGNDPF